MPARVARSTVTKEKPTTKRKRNQRRALDAFSIATEEEPDSTRVRQHRLGESEGDDPRRKRQRLQDDDDSDDGPSEPQRQQRKTVTKGRFDELDVSEGSDSEGNNWRMGEVDEDDDSDIDSDDAFGESDEERFEGFTFRGSSKNQPRARRRRQADVGEDGGIDLDDGEQDAEGDDDEDSLGEDAVDLATMLDNYEGSEEEDASSDEEGDEAAELRDDREHAEGLRKLSSFVSNLPLVDEAQGEPSSRSRHDPNVRPGDASNRPKLSMDAFVAADENVKSIVPSFKQAKRYTSGRAVEVPLPERQRAKLEREAADKKATETLERWVDTVKHNRRAEHISFPLVDNKETEILGARKLLPTSRQAPTTDLEKAIANIMQQSGLVANAKQQEKQLQEFEELQMNKLPIEEVENRRAALRQARDLMFREEIKAKRIKKIKSKAYRRVHRKERERQAMRDADVFGEGEMDEEERERLDRRRAEERMGAKHRESKWAKAVKKTGQAAWDEDARDGITDMARRNEELRRRQQGRAADSDGLTASEASEDDDEPSDDEAARNGYKKSLDQIDLEVPGKRSALSNMKFMRDAEAAKRQQNEEDIERLRRELNGEDPFEDGPKEERIAGRRQYGPQVQQANGTDNPSRLVGASEFEAQEALSSEGETEIIIDQASQKRNGGPKLKEALPVRNGVQSYGRKDTSRDTPESDKEEQNPFLMARKSKGGKRRTAQSPEPMVELLPGEVHSKPDADGFTTVTYATAKNNDESESSDEDEPDTVPTLSRQQELFRQAFAGDDTFEDFAKEKKQLAAEDDDKVVDNSMPGWGAWTGDALPKREKRMAASLRQRLQTVQKGIRPEDRKDAKLKNVIISEKRIKKNGAYLANTLPFPFTTREEYERSMRMPVGGEWNTKGTVQKNVMPRVLVKPGRVITPLEAPIL